jgi:hypothetical protein
MSGTKLRSIAMPCALALSACSSAVGSATVNGQLPSQAATASFNVTNASCQSIESGNAVSGTVTLMSNDGAAYSGSFDLTFDSGDHVTGSFSAVHCAGIETLFEAAQNNTVSCG